MLSYGQDTCYFITSIIASMIFLDEYQFDFSYCMFD